MRLILMGPPCVGKTSFKSLLFNCPAPRVHHSTALATRPVRAIERVAEKKKGKIWDRVTRRDLLKMLSDYIRSIEQLLHEFNDSTLENAPTSTSLPSQLTSYVTENSSKQLKPFEGRNSSSDVKEGYSSSVDTADVCPICNSSTIMPSKTISLSSDVDAKSFVETTKISTVAHAMLNTASLPSDITASPITLSHQSTLLTDPDSYTDEMVDVLVERGISENLHKAT